MVSPTKRPDVLLVSFRCSFTDRTQNASARSADDRETEIVCYVRITETGFRIYYSHHAIFTKTGGTDNQTIMRFPLSTPLRGIIDQGVMLELWGNTERTFNVYPAPPESMLESVEGL